MAESNADKAKPQFLRWWAIALIFVGLAWFWAGIGGHSLWDRDEPRYSAATLEMLRTGDWTVPRFNGAVRYDKPIFVYWLMGLSTLLFGPGEFAVRAPAGVAGTLNALLLFFFARRLGAGPSGRALAVAWGLLTVLLVVISKAATTDAVLTSTVLAPMLIHWVQRSDGFTWRRHVVFWALVGVSMLHKGPVGPAIVLLALLTEAAWSWQAGDRPRMAWPPALGRAAAGLAVMVAVALPWAIAVTLRTDGEFLRVALQRHVVERVAEPKESHGGPFFYYLPVLLLGTFPFSALVLVAAPWAWRQRTDARVRLMLSWLLPGLVMFTLSRTKLPHYVAPLLPAVGLLGVLWWEDRERRGSEAAGPARGWWIAGAALMGLLGAGLVVGLPVAARHAGLPIVLPAGVAGLLAGAGALAGAVLWWRRDVRAALTTWSLSWAATVLVLYLWALPALEGLQPSKRLIGFLNERAPAGTAVYAVEFQEPTLVFYRRDIIRMLGRGEIAEGLEALEGPNPVAIVTTESRWEKWGREADRPVPEGVRIIFLERLWYPNRGKFETFVIASNFPVVSE